MKDWNKEIALASAEAERFEAQEAKAEEKFDAAHAHADAAGEPQQALKTKEFSEWIESRKATDAAWGGWAQLMDGKSEG